MARKLIFLTGATGFLGRHLVPCLLAEGYSLRLLVRRSSKSDWLAGTDVELIYGDITDPDVVDRATEGADYVIHAAGHFRFWGPPEVFDRINVQGTAAVSAGRIAASTCPPDSYLGDRDRRTAARKAF